MIRRPGDFKSAGYLYVVAAGGRGGGAIRHAACEGGGGPDCSPATWSITSPPTAESSGPDHAQAGQNAPRMCDLSTAPSQRSWPAA